ncbi:MAG: hypothetical protein QME58_05955 [Bacteroidota bacterium]|nr:hypothetical protein [Bacteroidota bacterium]
MNRTKKIGVRIILRKVSEFGNVIVTLLAIGIFKEKFGFMQVKQKSPTRWLGFL